MKLFVLLLLFSSLSVHLFGQQLRYTETIFEKADTLKNVEYATADWLNNPIPILAEYNIHDGEYLTETRPLFMDIFTPHGDTLTKRPAIIFLHSGAFILGSRKNDDMVALCDSFARRGYVTATIDYRLGMGAEVNKFLGVIIYLAVTEKNAIRASYRALQDSRAAIRFLRHNCNIYGIDSTKIFMVGSSAGAITALTNVFVDTKEDLPSEVFTDPDLGDIDFVGVQKHNPKADAVVALWGSIQNTTIIDDEKTPLLLVHGKADDIVPFEKGVPLDSIVEPNPLYSFTMPESWGSYCIDTALVNRNVFHETYFVENEKHEFYGVVTGDFPEEGPNQYWDSIQWKMSDFFFERFKPEADFETETYGLSVNLNNISNENNYSLWEFENGETATGNLISHTFSEEGTYKIKLTTCNKNLACDTITKSVSIGRSVFVSSTVLPEINIYPNPVQNTIHIKGISQLYNATIYDLVGRKREVINKLEDNNIDVSSLENGLYILEIELNGYKIHRKFLKQN